jgi:drug/metabolite transporter (DMT)-like permease
MVSKILLCQYNQKLVSSIPLPDRKFLLLWSSFGVIGWTTLQYSLEVLPLFIVQILNNTTPFWATIIAFIFLGDTVTKVEIVCLIGCFAGVTAIAVSQVHANGNSDSAELKEKSDSKNSTKTGQYIFGIIMILVTALTHSSAAVITKKLANVHFAVLNICYGIFATGALFIWLLCEYIINDLSHQ